MPNNENENEKKLVRYRERTTTEPQGFARVTYTVVRVVENDGPIPEGCEATTDDLHDWVREEK